VITTLGYFLVKTLQQSTKHQYSERTPKSMHYLTSMPAVEGVLKLDTIRWRRRLKACSISFDSDAGSIRQNDPLPGSSCDLGTFTKNRFSERLCRIEFCKHNASSGKNKLHVPCETYVSQAIYSVFKCHIYTISVTGCLQVNWNT